MHLNRPDKCDHFQCHIAGAREFSLRLQLVHLNVAMTEVRAKLQSQLRPGRVQPYRGSAAIRSSDISLWIFSRDLKRLAYLPSAHSPLHVYASFFCRFHWSFDLMTNWDQDTGVQGAESLP